MNIEKQVCSLEQGKKLKELGVIQPCNEFWYDRNGNLYMVDRLIGFPNRRRLNDETLHNATTVGDFFPAFTVAELGVMISGCTIMPLWGKNFPLDDPAWQAFRGDGECIALAETEALARADVLIYLLESNLITATKLNSLLKHAA